MTQKQNTYSTKEHIPRLSGIPEEFPFKCYSPTVGDIPSGSPEILVGMDSGISNLAFCSIELIRDVYTGSAIDFKFIDAYYFKSELDKYAYKMDKQLYLAEQYFNLFSHKNVNSLTFEVLSLTSIKNEETLNGVIDAQATTDLIKTVAYLLKHRYNPIPATAIKFCLTGSGKATKYDMRMAAYSWTKEEALLYNDHMADAFACAFYSFIKMMIQDCMEHHIPIPAKFSHMKWNFKNIPSLSCS